MCMWRSSTHSGSASDSTASFCTGPDLVSMLYRSTGPAYRIMLALSEDDRILFWINVVTSPL